jgi:FkbM family methyltransferase
LVLLAASAAVFMANPPLRTRGFFAFFRAWHAHWPLAAGQKLPERLLPAFRPFVPIWVEVAPGVTMWLDPHDVVTGYILAYGNWEPWTTRELMRHTPPGGTFVGAHVGWYSLNAARAVGPKGRVIAVEPDHGTLPKLRENIRASRAGAVVMVAPVACADSESTLTFYSADPRNTGESSLSADNASQDGAIAASYPVRARRLDDILREAGVGRVHAIKIDVEGAEFLVLKGAVETLDRYRPVVAVEIVDRQLKSMGSSESELRAFMHAHGYRAVHAYEQNTIFVPDPKAIPAPDRDATGPGLAAR